VTSAPSAEVTLAQPTAEAPIRVAPWVVLLVSAGILSVVLPALVLRQVPNDARSGAWVLALAVAIWSGFRVSLIVAHGSVRLFAFFFWLFTYIFMGLAPAVQIRGAQPSKTTPDISSFTDAHTMWVVILGIVMFEVGTLAAHLIPESRRAHGQPSTGDRAFRPAVTIALLVLGLAFGAYFLQRVGLAALFTSREAAVAAKREAFPDLPVYSIVSALAVYPTLAAVGALIALRRSATSAGTRVGYLLLILAGVAMLAVVVNPIGTARYPSGTVAFAFVVLAGALNTPARVRTTLIATVLGLFFVFPIADAFRRTGGSVKRLGFFQEYLGNPDYDAVWQVSNALTYWSSGLAQAGRQALALPLFWVPRNVWADKPTDTGIMLAGFQHYPVSNLSAPLWAEAIVNGGLVGLVVVFLLFGYLVRRLDSRVLVSVRSPSVWLVVGAIFPAYSLILLRGSLLQATGAVVVTAASLLLVRRPQRRRLTQEE
jgi:hypothetical protein